MRNQGRNASPPTTVNCTVRKYLTAREIEKLMDYARKHSRYGHRDATMILVTYRHGLRASEVCDLQWHQVELDQGRMHVRRAKNGTPSVHPIRGDEIRALRKLRRESPNEAYVFLTERGGSMSTIGFHHLIQRLGKAARCLSHCILTCCGMRAAISLPTTGTIPVPCSTISATGTSSTPSATPSFRPTGSATSCKISVAGKCG
jgi:integrase